MGWTSYDERGRSVTVRVTEDHVARHFAEEQAGHLLYCHEIGAWFVWEDGIWRRDTRDLVLRLARDRARRTAADMDESIGAAGRVRFAMGVETFARGDAALAAPAGHWDRDPLALGTPGGTVDLTTGVLRPADPADGITRATAVTPAETDDCPLWRRFIGEATGGDEGLALFLQRFFGYCLTGKVTEQLLLFGLGPGGNGKTVLMNTIAGVMGDHARVATLDTFAGTGDRVSNDLALLRGIRLVTIAETEQGRVWAPERLKLLTGGDPILARPARRAPIAFAPTFKLFVVGNHPPALREVDPATRRRLCIVPFDHRPESPDRDLADKLRAEWPAILRWMIEGCLQWQEAGLARPDSVREATGDYFGGQDLVGQFLDEACETGDPAGVETVADLYAAWTRHARAAAEAPGTRRAFGEALEQRGVTRDRTRHARLYRGIRLKQAAEGVTRDGA